MPCHNRQEALRFTLDSLCRQTHPASDFDVLVVDQASTDGSRELVEKFDTPYKLELLEQDCPYGPSVARNAGIEAAASKTILLLDADMLADPGLVAAHLVCHASHPDALAYGRVKPYPIAYTSFVDQVADPDAFLDRGTEDKLLPFYQGFSNHQSFSKSTFTHVGLFDPLLRAYEDIDFAYRASQMGFTILNCPDAISYHNHPRTLRERYTTARTYNRMLPVLLDRYPELRNRLPPFLDFEPIDWREDRFDRLISKLRVRAFSTATLRGVSLRSLNILNHFRVMPYLVRGLYWQLLIGSKYLGFKDGMARVETNES